MNRSPALRRVLLICIKGCGVILFLWILSRIDRAQLVHALAHASLPLVFIGWCLFPVIYLLKSWRWHVLVTRAGVVQSFEMSFKTYCSALFLGMITPGNAGEAMKIAYLRSAGSPLKDATLLTVLDRLFDVFWIGLFALPSVFFLLRDRFLVLTLTLIAIGLCSVLALGIVQRMFGGLETLLREGLRWKPHVITLCNWAVYYVQLLIFARAFGIDVPLLPFVAIMTIAGSASLLAVAPAGLGTRDAVVLYFFTAYAVPPSLAVAFSFSVFILTLAGSLIGGYCLLQLPVSKEKNS